MTTFGSPTAALIDLDTPPWKPNNSETSTRNNGATYRFGVTSRGTQITTRTLLRLTALMFVTTTTTAACGQGSSDTPPTAVSYEDMDRVYEALVDAGVSCDSWSVLDAEGRFGDQDARCGDTMWVGWTSTPIDFDQWLEEQEAERDDLRYSMGMPDYYSEYLVGPNWVVKDDEGFGNTPNLEGLQSKLGGTFAHVGTKGTPQR